MRNELNIQTLHTAKANAVAFYNEGGESQDFWEMVVQDIDDEILDIGRETPVQHLQRRRNWIAGAVIVAILVVIVIACSSCKMVQGAGEDITWMGGAGEKFLEYRDKGE